MTFITEDACKYVTDIILRNNYNAINGAFEFSFGKMLQDFIRMFHPKVPAMFKCSSHP